MTRSPNQVEALGVEALLCDAYDADALRSAVVAAQPGRWLRVAQRALPSGSFVQAAGVAGWRDQPPA